MKGWFAYKSKLGHTVCAMQVEGVYNTFLELFQREKFDRVLEIGTAQCGTTLIVRDALNESGQDDCEMLTYDPLVTAPNLTNYIEKNQKITFLQENIFSSNYQSIKQDCLAIDFIKKPGKTLVLCDGGCKQCEIKLLTPFLKSGDFIMGHDYAKTDEHFKHNVKDKIWNWLELTFNQFSTTFFDNDLEFYMEEEFASVAWFCATKK